jgi:hypothetical protein
MSKARPHLDGGAFAAKRQAGADREQAANELDWNKAKPDRRKLATQNCFNVRDSASRRMGREAANQPGRQSGCARASGNYDREAEGPPPMSPSDRRVAQTVRLNEGETENRSHKACESAGDEREQRQR